MDLAGSYPFVVFGYGQSRVLWFSFLYRDGIAEAFQCSVVDCALKSAVTSLHVLTPSDRSLSIGAWDLVYWVLDQM